MAGAAGPGDTWEEFLATLSVQEPLPGPCVVCGVRPELAEVAFRRCRRCKTADYCSDECQRAHWQSGHKLACTVLLQEPIGRSNEHDLAHKYALEALPSAWPPRECVVCGGKQFDKEGEKDAAQVLIFRRCARCQGKIYCSETCQRLHWRNAHRFECKDSHSSQRPLPISRAPAPPPQKKTAREEMHSNRKLMGNQVIRVQYDAGALGFEASNALDPSVTGFPSTGLALVVGKPTVYVMMMLMWALWMIKTYHACQWQAADSSCRPASVWMESNVLTRPSLSGIGRMVTYSVCLFYMGKCFDQYRASYWRAIDMCESIDVVSINLEAYFCGTATKWNVIRYLLAAHYFFYWNLAQKYMRFGSSDFTAVNTPGFDAFCKKLEAKGLLIPMEIDCLRNKNEQLRIVSLMAWAMIAFRRIVSTKPPHGEKGNPKLQTCSYEDGDGVMQGSSQGLEEAMMGLRIREAILRIKAQMMTTASALECPFPFFCYHYVQVLLYCYMSLLAYESLFENESVLVIFLYMLTILPLLVAVEIANTLSSPFGKDLVDFNIEALLEPIFEDCNASAFEKPPAFYDMIGTPEWCPNVVFDPVIQEEADARQVGVCSAQPPEAASASPGGSSAQGRHYLSGMVALNAKLNAAVPRQADGSIDVKRVVAKYERRRSGRIKQSQAAADKQDDTAGYKRGWCERLFGPVLAPFRDEQNPGWYKTKKEVRESIVASMRGEWKHQGSQHWNKLSAESKDDKECRLLSSNQGCSTFFDYGLEEYLERLAAEAQCNPEAEEVSSVSTTCSVRRLNSAISDLGFYMQTEVEHVDSIARRVDLFEKALVQHVLKIVAYIDLQRGVKQHPHNQYLFEHLQETLSGSAADAASRMSLAQRVQDMEHKVVLGEHLPLHMPSSQRAEMQAMALETQLPWARAHVLNASHSTPQSTHSHFGGSAQEALLLSPLEGASLDLQQPQRQPRAIEPSSPLKSSSSTFLRSRSAHPILPLQLSSRSTHPEAFAAAASSPSRPPVLQ